MQNYNIKFLELINFLFNVLWKKLRWQMKLRTVIVILFVFTVVIANVSIPILFKMIIDKIGYEQNFQIGILLFASYGILWLLTQVFTHLREVLAIPIFEEITRNTVIDVFKHLNKLSLEFFTKPSISVSGLFHIPFFIS